MGKQDFETPFNSHLAMADAELSLLDIINANLSNHEFAFLSACQTAVGDGVTPDEMIHLAAGSQFTGVKSVIGTLDNQRRNSLPARAGILQRVLCWWCYGLHKGSPCVAQRCLGTGEEKSAS